MTDQQFSKEMGVTHKDFYRLLPRAMGDTAYEINGNTVHAALAGGALTISLGDPQIRRIALMAIPYAKVSFHFDGVDEASRSSFMQHFDLSFQRGGG